MKRSKLTHISLKGEHLSKRCLDTLANCLEEGEVVLLPTDTGYCYVGKPESQQVHKAFLRLRAAHPKHKPFSLLCPDIAGLSEIAVVSTPVYRILKKLLPGPYTCVLEKNKKTPITATSQKGNTVGVRIPAISYVEELMKHFGRPLLATSVTDAEELEREEYFDGNLAADAWWAHAEEITARHGHELAAYVDSGVPVPMRASTIFDFTREPPCMLRDGGWDTSGLTFDFQILTET